MKQQENYPNIPKGNIPNKLLWIWYLFAALVFIHVHMHFSVTVYSYFSYLRCQLQHARHPEFPQHQIVVKELIAMVFC